MHLTRPALLAALTAGLAAASAPDMLNEIRARFHGAGSALLARQSGSTNLQTFSGALGGITAEPVTRTSDSERPFAVGSDTFTDFADAAGRSCDNQMNSCATMANSGDNKSFTVSDCNDQNTQCKADITNEEVAVSAGTASASAADSSTSTSTTSTSTSTSFSTSFSSSSSSSSSFSSISTSTSTSTTEAVAAAPAPAAATTEAVTTEAATTTASASLALVSSNAEFNFFCEV